MAARLKSCPDTANLLREFASPKNKRRWIRPFRAILHRYRLLRRLQRLEGENRLWPYGNPNYAATFQKVGLTSDGGFVSGEWTLEFNNQNEAYIVKTDSGGDVNNCSDVQVTTATAGSLSETASLAKLSITVPANVAGSGTVSASSTSFTLSKECQ